MKTKRLTFTGETEDVFEGIQILGKKLDFEICDDGFKVDLKKSDGKISIKITDKGAEICFCKKNQFFRALAIFIEHFGEEFCFEEKQMLDTIGVMFDCSRNSVLKVDAFKKLIEYMALMGYNMAMLYTEDTYEVKEYPYFGYMRGRYTYEELKACDDYGYIFGIEVIPCIQTLGHLKRTLKWDHNADIKDTEDVLLVGSDDTYRFVRSLMEAASKPFRSNRIHLGLDEAHGIGLGAYLRRNGYTPASKLIRQHCDKVMTIADEMGLRPMIWADMYFRVKSTSGNYYEDLTGEFTEEDRKSVPENMSIVYWDYYKETNEEYRELIRLHKQLSDDVIFAGSVWSWNRFATSYSKTFATMIPAVEECISNNIKEAFITMWGDDASEANILGNLYGFQIFAELCYGHSAAIEYVDTRFEVCTGEKGEYFRSLDLLDDFNQDVKASNASKSMLWQDPLLGVFDKHIDVKNIGEIYAERKATFEKAKHNSNIATELFDFGYCVCDVLELKAELGIWLKKYYDIADISGLENIKNNIIPELMRRIDTLHIVWRKLWLTTYKIFGFEEIERRIGSLKIRIESTALRLDEYISGKTDVIEELEEIRLPINTKTKGLNFTELSYKRLMVSND